MTQTLDELESPEKIKNLGEALIYIGDCLKQLPDDETRLRVLKAAAALMGKRWNAKGILIDDKTGCALCP